MPFRSCSSFSPANSSSRRKIGEQLFLPPLHPPMFYSKPVLQHVCEWRLFVLKCTTLLPLLWTKKETWLRVASLLTGELGAHIYSSGSFRTQIRLFVIAENWSGVAWNSGSRFMLTANSIGNLNFCPLPNDSSVSPRLCGKKNSSLSRWSQISSQTYSG